MANLRRPIFGSKKVQIDSFSEAITMQESFRFWFLKKIPSENNYKIIVDCLARVSDYIYKTGISTIPLWNIKESDLFESILDNNRLNINMQRLGRKKRFKEIFRASQLYLDFLKFTELSQEDKTENNLTEDLPSTQQLNETENGIQYSNNDNNADNTSHHRFKSNEDLLADNNEKRIMSIISGKFTNGFRISSNIDFDRLKKYYEEQYSEEIPYDANKVNTVIKSLALTFDGRAYHYNKDVITKVEEYLLQIGSPCISIDYFFKLHTNELYLDNIFSVDMLHAFFSKYFDNISIKWDYVLLKENINTIDLINEIAVEREEWTFNELCKRLPYLKVESIRQAFNSAEYLWVNTNTYAHINNFDLPVSEGEKIVEVVDEALKSQDYVIANSLDLSKFTTLNSHYPFTAIRDAVFQTFLSDKYSKSGQVITKKGVKLRVIDILEQYCRNADTATFEEMNEFEASFDPNGKTHSACLIAGYNTMVRVNDDLFVSDGHVTFDVKSIDEAIAVYCRGDFVPLCRVIDFSLFPFVGYPWNLYLLESYVRRFSNEFKYDVRAVNSSNIGVIVKKDFRYSNYDDILSIALANSFVDIDSKIAVGDYLFENGYIGWRNLGKNENKIITNAKKIRENGIDSSIIFDEANAKNSGKARKQRVEKKDVKNTRQAVVFYREGSGVLTHKITAEFKSKAKAEIYFREDGYVVCWSLYPYEFYSIRDMDNNSPEAWEKSNLVKPPREVIEYIHKMTEEQLEGFQDNQGLDIIDEIIEKCIIIKITQHSIDYNNGSIYEATRKHWKISIDRARNADYAISTQKGVVIEIYTNLKWEVYEDGHGRIMFNGIPASDDIRNKYIGRIIPPEYRKIGMASPCLYVNC
ncbi:MAG: hypothetical protein FWD47_14850 [Treponema sp.]|nr:hypothetical protein [Treponema sp.]